MITNPTVIRTLDTRSLIAVTVSGSNGDNVGGTVTVSKGGTSYTATTDSNGQANIFVDSPGSWTVGYDKSGITASGSVSVVYSGYTYQVSLSVTQPSTVYIYAENGAAGGSFPTLSYGGVTKTLGTMIPVFIKSETFSASFTFSSLSMSGDDCTISVSNDGVSSNMTLTNVSTTWLTPRALFYVAKINNWSGATAVSSDDLPLSVSDGDYVLVFFNLED